MNLNSIRLSTRITLGMLLLVAAGALLWIVPENERLHDAYFKARSADVESVLHAEKLRMGQSIEILRQSTLFLANVPPISGIARAASNRGTDPRDKNSYATWEARLQEIFTAFLRAHPDYFQARFIGVADDGRELVRVERRADRIEVTPREALQAKGDRDYFKAGLTLALGRVYLSEFNLNQEYGKVEQPHRPTLRAVTPVFDASGHLFGMVVINQDASGLLNSASAGLPAGMQAFIADQQGRYLLHPDSARAFSFDTGGNDNIAADFPSLKPLFGAQKQNYLPLHAESIGGGVRYLAAERVYFDAGNPARFLLLAYCIPPEVVAKQAAGIAPPNFFAMLLVVAVGGLLMLVLRRTFAPLKRIAAAARKIAAGEHDVRLPKTGGGEITELADALNVMLDKLSDSEVLARENAFRKELIDSLPGIFYMIDPQGNFLLWNRKLELVLRCSQEEILFSHPLDFFEGEDKVKIENAIRQVFIEGEAEAEAVLLSKDGSRTPYQFTGRRVGYNGRSMLVGLGTDISLLQQSMLRHERVLEAAMDGFWMASERGVLEEVNAAYASMSGYTRQELIGMHISQLDANEQERDVRARIDKIITQGYDRFEAGHRRKDGEMIEVEVSATYMPEEKKFFVFCHDITQRKHYESDLRVAAATFETQDATLITDAQSNIIRVNRAFTEITGYTPEEVLGRNPRIMSSGRHDKAFYGAMWRQILERGAWAGEVWDRRKNGEIYPKWLTITAVKNEDGKVTQYVAIFNDITARKQAEDEIRNLAFYDALTRLPNRRLFQERFHAALVASARYRDFGAILFIDLDRFKVLNDTLGHDYGDLLLIEVAERIRGCVREMDTVARLGGDEFVVLLESISSDKADAERKSGLVAEKIRESLSRPYQLKEHEHYSSPSIGITLYHGDDESMDALLQHADAAMYQAKSAGRNAARFYDPGMQQELVLRSTLENDLRRAIENKELYLYYQLQVDNGRHPVGAEALIRWINPQRGLVSPASFIPVAEESSLILEIGNWVMEQGCAQLAAWGKAERLRDLTLAVNVSAHQFRRHDFVELVEALLQRYRIDPSRLKLELTEGVVVDDMDEVVTKMLALKGLGVLLSLDDFGTGYSSLSYLKRLPLDQVKIDQSFVRGITVDPGDAVMVQTIIDMAKNFNLEVIAEGVETEEQFTFLKQHDCMAYQGYLFGKPLPLEQMEAMILKD
ncbi:MAG: EAL domain-containing protein [Sideroxydans sp.]|nr:EAL domain-containing protein [Sideroxydans sp.]